MDGGGLAGLVIGIIFGVFLIWYIFTGLYTVREKEVIIIERFGSFKEILTAGIHWVWPLLDRPKVYPYRYLIDKGYGYRSEPELVESSSNYRISLQHEVLDFPKQQVITRDNAMIMLDAVLSYQLISGTSARTMVYSVTNLPYVLSQLLQAHMRNVAATLDVDQIIEDSASLNVLTQLMNDTSMRWGVKINFVKIQKVEPAHDLAAVMAKKKNADLTNKNVIITAKSTKQTTLLSAEGTRDRLIKTAEGEAQKKKAKAQGEATAIVNAARAEAEALNKIVPVIKSNGGDPIKYFLNQKYMSALEEGLGKSGRSSYNFLPQQSANLQIAAGLGLNAIPAYAVAPGAPPSIPKVK